MTGRPESLSLDLMSRHGDSRPPLTLSPSFVEGCESNLRKRSAVDRAIVELLISELA
jgi:hypothetical protein